jgi:hypothetical protein
VKPNFTKPKPQPQQSQTDYSDDEDGPHFLENQPRPENLVSDVDFSDNEDVNESDYASDASHDPKKRKLQKKAADDASMQQQPKAGKQGKIGQVKTAARKIKATAHANFRRLNIKSKAGNGGKGRYGRR